MTESAAGPALPPAERQAAEALLADAWGGRTEIRAAEAIWDRSHVIRLHLGADRSVVLKRRGEQEGGVQDWSFEIELAALEYLNAMPVPLAPRLLAEVAAPAVDAYRARLAAAGVDRARTGRPRWPPP